MTHQNPTIGAIADCLEAFAPRSLQESYDNCGLTLGNASRQCTGVLLTVDVTPEVVAEAVAERCNLIVAHHPVIFHGLKSITGATLQEKAIIDALRADVAVYSCHTSLDNAPAGVSHRIAAMLGLQDVEVLDPRADASTGSGIVGNLPVALTGHQVIEKVKSTFGSPAVRCSRYDMERPLRRVALCGGAGGFLIPNAVAAGAEIMINSDTRYHDFLDFRDRILIVDIGHHESENCTKDIFCHVIKEKFPIFAVRYADADENPIKYF